MAHYPILGIGDFSGSENLHHKRKQQSRKSLKRKAAKRAPYDVVLIVCEGEKTEPNYLKGICDELQLNSTNIKVLGLGADPLQIVEQALYEFKHGEFDKIYCVFDKDNHTHYQAALDKIKHFRERNKSPVPIHAIISVPCFEYWLLLHFSDSSSSYVGSDSKSAADKLCNVLKNYIKDYHKGHKNIFELTKSNLTKAIARAKKIYKEQEKNGSDNPSTNMHELVEYLMSIKNKRYV